MLPREELLKGIENRDCAVRAIDCAEQAIKTWEVTPTNFQSPPELAEIVTVFKRLTDVELVAWGGYPQAERQRIAIARSSIPIDSASVSIAAVEIAGNFLFDVRVNWKDITQASYNVKWGDLIAVSGKGRLEIGEVAVTKKERYRVQLTRYL
jgi:RNA-binding protein YlmH